MEKIYNFIKEHLLVIILGLIILILFICSGYFYYLYISKECIVDECPQIEQISNKIIVDIKGSVVNPGVYELNSDAIINDVITLAGGFTKSAYTKNINLSKKVSNELVIYIYSKNEYKKLNQDDSKIITKECSSIDYNIDNCIDTGISIITNEKETNIKNENTQNNKLETSNTDSKESNNENGNLININTATLQELMSLSGVGESKANKIISYREQNGSFKTIEEIKNVDGIGDKMYEQIKDFITV